MRAQGPLLRFGLDIGFAFVLALGAVFAAALLVTLGAEPTPVPVELLESGDLRSEGAGPGLVGSPLLILAGVVLLGVVTVLVTIAIVRLTQHD